MGFARLSAGRTSVIVDAADRRRGRPRRNAHASTLAFELTSGRRPLIVNCGSGAGFGADWRRAGRATPSHSTLCCEGYSSARLGGAGADRAGTRELLDGCAARRAGRDRSHGAEGYRFEGGHDGYVAQRTGLTHARRWSSPSTGAALAGEDLLIALDEPAKRRFDKAMDAVKLRGIAFTDPLPPASRRRCRARHGRHGGVAWR